MFRTLSVLLVGGILVGTVAGCTADDDGPSGRTATRGSQPSPVGASAAPASSPTTPSPTLRDPLLDLADSGQAPSVQGQSPLLSEQGSAQGEYTLVQNRRVSDAVVAVSCVGPGRYTVRGDGAVIIDSECTGRAAANIRLPLARVGTKIEVTAPSAFWVTIVPAI